MRSPSDLPTSFAAIPHLSESQEKILQRVQAELDASNPHKAFELLKAKECSNVVQCKNARGVCLMRMDELDDALRIFRDLCLTAGGLIMREDVPTLFKTNLATVLVLKGNINGCQNALAEAKDEASPQVIKLRAALADWKRSLSAWQRFMLFLGVEPKTPVDLPFPPGDLL